jgi:hypothetical protein
MSVGARLRLRRVPLVLPGLLAYELIYVGHKA